MAILKLLSSKDDAATQNFMQTSSGKHLINLSTDKPADQGFITKQQIYDDIKSGKLTGDVREREGEMYDHVVVEFGSDKTLAESALPVILNRFQNPNMMHVKNQGNGRIQEKKITGKKEVLYDLHHETNGDFHLHIFVARYAIDGNKVCSQDSQKDKYVRANYLDAINQDLEKAGLASLRDFSTAITASSSSTPKASLVTQTEVKQALASENVADAIQKIDLSNASISDVVLDDTITKAEKELANLVETAKQKAEELAKMREAANVLAVNKTLAKAVETLQAENSSLSENLEKTITDLGEANNNVITLTEKNTELEAGVSELTELNTNLETELEETKKNFLNELNERDLAIEERDKQVDSLLNEREEIKTEIAQINQEVSALTNETKQIPILKDKIKGLEENAKLKDELLSSQKSENESLKERFNDLQKRLENANARNEQLRAENEKHTKFTDALKAEKNVYISFIEQMSDRMDKITDLLNKVTAKVNITAAAKKLVKSLTADNEELRQAGLLVDKDTDRVNSLIAQKAKEFAERAQATEKKVDEELQKRAADRATPKTPKNG